MPYLGPSIATPYFAMIQVEDCTVPVPTAGFDLEGREACSCLAADITTPAGKYPAIGLVLRNNRSSGAVARVKTQSHLQDGMIVDGIDADTPDVSRTIRNVSALRNGRQSCSFASGAAITFPVQLRAPGRNKVCTRTTASAISTSSNVVSSTTMAAAWLSTPVT